MNRRGFLQRTGCALCAWWADPRPAVAGTAPAQYAGQGLLGPRRSPYFATLDHGALRCTLCPRACLLAPGRRGACRVRENRDGQGYTLVYGNPAIVQLDPIERLPFYHVLPASRSFSVSTAGCNLACKFCQVWDVALVAPEEVYAYALSPDQVVDQALENQARSVAAAFGEPVAFFEYALDIAVRAREAGLLSLLHSNGYLEPGPLDELGAVLDAANIDLKAFDRQFYRQVVGGELDPVLDTLRRLKAAGVHLEITQVLIPTLNDNMQRIGEMGRWICDHLGPEVPLHFTRFYPLYKLTNLPPTPVSMLDEARQVARHAGLRYVYVGNVAGHEGQHTYCPGCGEALIRRLGFMVEEVRMKDGACAACGSAVSGIWR